MGTPNGVSPTRVERSSPQQLADAAARPVAPLPTTSQPDDVIDLAFTSRDPDYVEQPAAPAPQQQPRGADGRFQSPQQTFEHNPWTVRESQALGFEQAEIDATPTDELQRLIHSTNRAIRAQSEANARNAFLYNQPPQQQRQAPAQQVEPRPQPQEQPPDELGFLDGIDGEISAPLKKYLKATTERLSNENKEFRQQLAEIRQLETNRGVESKLQMCDRVIRESRPGIFGDKPMPSLKKDDPQGLRRVAVINFVEAILKPPQQDQQGRWVSQDFDEADIERAIDLMYGPKQARPNSPPAAPRPSPQPSQPRPQANPPQPRPAAVRENPEPPYTPEEWEQMQLNRPAATFGDEIEQPGVGKAIRGVARHMRDNNIDFDEVGFGGGTNGDMSKHFID